MRRFESARAVRLRTPAGRWLDLWVAESFRLRLTGLAGLAGLPPGRGLLLPACRSVHTVAMRFRIDVAFVSWPPAHGRCDVMAVEAAMAPLRLAAPRGLPPARVAALETAAGELPSGGVRPGARLTVVAGPRVG
jgi:hypothetical protein